MWFSCLAIKFSLFIIPFLYCLKGKTQNQSIDTALISDLQFFCNYYQIPFDSGSIELYRISADWLGAKYAYNGRSCHGIDCSGLVKTFWQILYGADLSGSSADLFQLCEVIEDSSMWLPGDWVFFKIAKNKISHSGIYLGNNKFIHSTTRAGVIISDLNEPYYKKHFYAVGRLKK